MIDLKELVNLSKELKILYVEDDRIIRASMTHYLLKLFPNIVVANDGEVGLELYKTQKFDIVITDLSMPLMNGLEMISKIKELNTNQAILITTAHTESDYMLKSIKLGVDGYIIKPFEYEQLNHELFKIVEKLKKYAENEEYKTMLQAMVEKKTAELSNIVQFQSYNYEKTLLSMVEMIEERDTYTAGHSQRVAEYSKRIAQEMSYSDEECTRLYQAGIMHDIGKIATPDAVLLNPKNLNDIEYKLIQEHVEVGFRLLKNIPMFSNLAEIVRSHHERYDGKGYPQGLRADEIPPLARIMTVADAFDAMTTNRIYKARKNVKEALSELVTLKSIQFDPDVVEKALIALQSVTIDEDINQLPTTKLEQERFAYFYQDRVSEAYNHSYLEIVLMKNSHEKEFKYMDIFFLNNFSQYNKIFGWGEGDKFLRTFAICLNSYFTNSLVFRIFGDDFAVMSREKVDIEELKIKLNDLVKNSSIHYTIKSIDLEVTKIENIIQLEIIE
ncbi:MAG: HD domain-containing phosphohydrolase [Sulfurimonas sp.]|jgi:putative nucleotidyltransferase with HDIG domain